MSKQRLNGSKIRQFLNKLTDLEFRYLRMQIDTASQIRQIVMDHNITREKFIELAELDIFWINEYFNGNYHYDIHYLAKVQAGYCKLKAIEAEKEANKLTHVVT